MKKFYCLYNKNNLPFSWKLKQANEKPIANFKSREDCLNYYLSLNNVGIIWFQKASTKATKKENLKDSFAGYIKSELKNDVLLHTIGVVPGTTENAARILKRNLFHSLQIDPETGRDLLDEKGIDRLYNNKNSYLIFDNDIAEEISTVYDAKPIKIEKEKDNNNSIDEKLTQSSSSPEILRNIVKNSPPNIKNNEKIDEKDIILDVDVEYNELDNKKDENLEFAYNNVNWNNNGINEPFNYSSTQPSNFENYNFNYQNNGFQNYGIWTKGSFGVNINDFDFKNDFGNYKLRLQPKVRHFLLNNLNNNFVNNGKILKNDFHRFYGSKGAIMNSNGNKFNTTNLGNGSNDVWVPVGQSNNPNIQRPYGTVEFTAVPNQLLNTELNPLGANTMIFNPYSIQNQFQNQQPQPYVGNNSSETFIQPIIQPIIQTVYQQPPVKTTVLEPIVNEPIMANDNNNSYADYYSQYANTSTLNIPRQNDSSSEFRFNNNNNVERTNSFNSNTIERNFNAEPQQQVSNSNNVARDRTSTQQVNPSTNREDDIARTQNNPIKAAPAQNKNSEIQKKTKSNKKALYTSLMIVSLLIMIAIIVLIVLFVTGVIVI